MTYLSKTFAISALLIGVLGISGCDQKSEASPENYRVAIQKALDLRPAICVPLPEAALPFDEPIEKNWGSGNYQRAQALTATGLLTSAKTRIPLQVDKSVTVEGERFTLTELGKKYFVPAEVAISHPEFCGGKRKVRDITSFTAAAGKGLGSQVLVVYSYDVTDAPAWAASPALRKIYVADLQPSSQTMNTQALLELTRDGWIVTQ